MAQVGRVGRVLTRSRQRALTEFGLGLVGVLVLVALWWYGGEVRPFIPPVGDIAGAAPEFLTDPETWADVWATLLRVVGSLVAALILGTAAALSVSRENFLSRVVDDFIKVALGIPSVIAALIALFMFRRSDVGVYVVVTAITFPYVCLTLAGGLKAADRRLDELAASYRFSSWQRLRHIYLPHLVPYMFMAVRNEYAHAWRVVILAELFAVSSGMGARFGRAFDAFMLNDVMLWLLMFIFILGTSEYLVIVPAEKWLTRWKTVATR